MTAKDECCGTRLYRFQPYADADSELRGNKIGLDFLWFSTPRKLNDPMDIDHPLDDLMRDVGGDSPLLRDMAKVMYDSGQEKFPKGFITEDILNKIRHWARYGGHSLDMCHEFRERLLQLGVACFTPDWNNPPMWAHYASNWRGFAIEYCVRQIDMATSPKNDAFWQLWVNYSSRIEQTSLSELLFSPHEAATRILSAKTLPWSYENEWRLIHLPGGDCSAPMPIGMRMTGIILGPKSPPEQDELFEQKRHECGPTLKKIVVGLDRTLHLQELPRRT
jgi:hypothetical protein